MKRSKGPSKQDKPGQRWDLPAGSQVWVYLRHSPGDHQTIDSQREAMLAWCAERGWTVVQVWTDAGVEGSREDRAQFQAMLAASRQQPRPVDGVVLWSFSRFARSQLDAQLYKAELRKRGYVILSKSDDIPDNEMAPLFETLVDWKNQRYLEDLSADARRGLHYVAGLGYWPGGPAPTGYRVERVQIGVRHGGAVRWASRLVQDEAVAEQVAQAWRMKLADASYRTILEATGLFDVTNDFTWFFSNTIYAGILTYGGQRYPAGWETGGRFCPPYVTLEEFDQVQQLRAARTIGVVAPRALVSRYLLSGLVWCGVCQDQGRARRMAGYQGSKPHHRGYRCDIKDKALKGVCTMPMLGVARIEEPVLRAVREQVLTRDYVRLLVAHHNQAVGGKEQQRQQHYGQAERQVRERRRAYEAVVTLIERKGVDEVLSRRYDEARAAWTNAVQRRDELHQLTEQGGQAMLTEEQAYGWLERLLGVLEQGAVEERRRVLKSFVERIVAYPDHVEIHYKFGLENTEQGGVGSQAAILSAAYVCVPRAAFSHSASDGSFHCSPVSLASHWT